MEKIKKIFLEYYPNSKNILVSKIGGMTNNNYLIDTNEKKYVLKLFGKGTDKLIDREKEKYNLKIIQNLNLDVNNYIFDITKGVKINEYIENAETLNSITIKTELHQIANTLSKIHSSNNFFINKFDVFDEIKKYESLISGNINYLYYEKIRTEVLFLKEDLNKIGIEYKNCHIDLVPENFIKDDKKLYLIDWEYSALNDPMWDLAALFLESDFNEKEEMYFIGIYEDEKNKINLQKILIYKILQDFVWSLWTIYKEEQGSDFGNYGTERYRRLLKNLREYRNKYDK